VPHYEHIHTRHTSLMALVAVAVAAGMVRGIMTLLQATAVTERWGPTHYGHLSGVLSAPIMLTTALGPFIGAALASLLDGYDAMFLLLGVIAAAAAGLAPPLPFPPRQTHCHRSGHTAE
jgi:MFS family permease